MLKKVVFCISVLFLVFQSSAFAGISQDSDRLRFSNWPLSGFEEREVLRSFGEGNHKGVDIAAEVGEEVRAVADGKVYWTNSGGSNGIAVGIEHENGWRTTYLQLSKRLVKRGQVIQSSQVIGKVGVGKVRNDESVAHLHLGLKINPDLPVWDPDHYGDPLLFGPVLGQGNEGGDGVQQSAEESSKSPASQMSESKAPVEDTGKLENESISGKQAKQSNSLANVQNRALFAESRVRSQLSSRIDNKAAQKTRLRKKASLKTVTQAKAVLVRIMGQLRSEKVKNTPKNKVIDEQLSLVSGQLRGAGTKMKSLLAIYWMVFGAGVYLFASLGKNNKKTLRLTDEPC